MPTPDTQTPQGFLCTDQYQFTMAQLFFRHGLHERPVQFDHFFRSYPDYGGHRAGYCINAGLESFIGWLEATRIRAADIAFLRGQRSVTGQRIFADDFLCWLEEQDGYHGLNVQAIPEGRVVHPEEPLTVVRGPLALCQLLETPLLNHLNYQTLVATKASRIHEAGHGRPILEFGMRRAQGAGCHAATRAALIGGADFSSNVGASHALGVPPKGTHAHSMVQLFMALGGTELDAFRAYAELYPDNCILLVDTVDTLNSGLPNAIRVFEELRRKGYTPVGVRLDSGDLAFLAIAAAKMLNAAGFPEVGIVLSNDLDELLIWQILEQIEQESPRAGIHPRELIGRLIYGVGTRLVTSWGCPALNGVYKLVSVQGNGHWLPSVKVSETASKTPNPGNKHAWRLYDTRGMATADLVALAPEVPAAQDALMLRHPSDASKFRSLPKAGLTRLEPLQVDVLREGRCVYHFPTLAELRQTRAADLAVLDPGVRRLINPHAYHVSLSQELWDLKQRLVHEMRTSADTACPGDQQP